MGTKKRSKPVQQPEVMLRFVPRPAATFQPDAPEGDWLAVVRGDRCRKGITQGGDPRLTIAFELMAAIDQKNASFVGLTLFRGIQFYDEADVDKRRAANFCLSWAKGLFEAANIELDDVWPTSIESLDDLDPIIAALNGRVLRVRTIHRHVTTPTGETTYVVDVKCLPRLPQPATPTPEGALAGTFMASRLAESDLLRAVLACASMGEIARLAEKYREADATHGAEIVRLVGEGRRR